MPKEIPVRAAVAKRKPTKRKPTKTMPTKTVPARRKPARREPGAPARRRRDPDATRQKLLTAARQAFARQGLAGARVDDIALGAGVNKQLVYHHFGDKDGLYLAVLEWIYEEIRTKENKLRLRGLAPDKAVKRLIEFSFDYLAEHPDFVALLNDENRLGAVHVRRSAKLPQMHSPFIALLDETLDRGVEAGLFRRGIDPMQLYVSIAGLGYFYFSNSATLSAIFKHDLASKPARRKRRRHIVDLVMHARRP
jgi:TetR/AcrR family transcriptional regulator